MYWFWTNKFEDDVFFANDRDDRTAVYSKKDQILIVELENKEIRLKENIIDDDAAFEYLRDFHSRS